jgi:hypothetical protein
MRSNSIQDYLYCGHRHSADLAAASVVHVLTPTCEIRDLAPHPDLAAEFGSWNWAAVAPGTVQLAAAILYDALGDARESAYLAADFANRVIMKLPADRFAFTRGLVLQWVEDRRNLELVEVKGLVIPRARKDGEA